MYVFKIIASVVLTNRKRNVISRLKLFQETRQYRIKKEKESENELMHQKNKAKTIYV